MKLPSPLCMFAIAVLLTGPAMAQSVPQTSGYVRVSAVHVDLADKGSIFVNGAQDPAAGYRTPRKWAANLELGYFLLPAVSLQGSVTSPVTTSNTPAGSLAGLPNLGDDQFSIFTVTGNFHPLRGHTVSPYVGGGWAVQHVWKVKDGLATNLSVGDANGPVIQAGIDFNITRRVGVFVDAKKIWYDAKASGGIGPAQINAKAVLDPTLFQAGVLFRF